LLMARAVARTASGFCRARTLEGYIVRVGVEDIVAFYAPLLPLFSWEVQGWSAFRPDAVSASPFWMAEQVTSCFSAQVPF
jgi:hypothetical protein